VPLPIGEGENVRSVGERTLRRLTGNATRGESPTVNPIIPWRVFPSYCSRGLSAQAIMNHRQRQTEFLRQCLLYDASSQSDALAERIRQLERNERCVARGVWLMIQMGALAFAWLGYLAVFGEDFPANVPGSMTWYISQVFCVLGLASLICVSAFVALGWAYRKELDERCDECRRRTTKLLERHLGSPRITTQPQAVKERQVFELVLSSPDSELGHGAAGVMEMTANK